MLAIKHGAKIAGLRPEILLGLAVVQSVLYESGFDTVITEGTGGTHMHGSLHYAGLALDIRSHDIPTLDEKRAILLECKLSLEAEFAIILENEGMPSEHFHVEYDPKS